MCRALELADAVDLDVIVLICKAVLEARQKHEELGACPAEAYTYVQSELMEYTAQAMLVQRSGVRFDPERKGKSDLEALHAIAVLIRWIRCEFGGMAS